MDNLSEPAPGDRCKWCWINNATSTIENVNFCDACAKKSIEASQKPQLCQLCRSLFVDEEITAGLYSKNGVYYSRRYLENNAESGCGLCRILLLQDPNPDWMQGFELFAGASRVEEPDWETGFASHEDVDSLYFCSLPGQFSLTISVSAREDDAAAKFISQRPASSEFGDEHTNGQIRDWLKECLESHRESLQDSSKAYMPTRVIDVAAFPGLDVRLFHPSEMDGQYIALSYCWGTQRFKTTTLENFERHKERITFSDLPQTFKDAITTTRNLGFRYLWIDALCIIQDSMDDKATEINTMGEIYTHAALTIASVAGTRVADGFLQAKAPIKVELPYRCPDGTMSKVEISPQRTVDLWQESLYTRAWCLQENLLSPRLLLYTGLEVLWQCQSTAMRRPNTTHAKYERDNPTLPSSAFSRLPETILHPLEGTKASEGQSIHGERYRTWTALVENYTRRRLSVASDRLPALAGIAQKFSEAWSDEYYYGIWKQYFIPSLAWRRDELISQESYAPLTEYRAPSWSWASIDGPVRFDEQYDIGNSRGLGAVLLEGIHERASESNEEYFKARMEASVIPVSELPRHTSHDGQNVYFDDFDQKTRYLDQMEALSEEMIPITWLMLLREGPARGSKKMRWTSALILMESSFDKGSFSRIGLLETRVKGAWKSWANPKYRRILTII